MEEDDGEFELDMDIVEAPLSRPRDISSEKGTMLDCVQELFTWVSYSTKECAKMKEVLTEHNETTFHDPEKPLMRTDIIEHENSNIGQPVTIPPHRVPPGQRKIVEDEILEMENEGNIQKS